MKKNLKLDLNNFKSNLGIIEKNDTTQLEIILENNKNYENCIFRLLGKKKDNFYIEQLDNIIFENNKLLITLNNQFTNVTGIVLCELNVVKVLDEITYKNFYFYVSETLNSNVIQSKDVVQTLEKLDKYLDNANIELKEFETLKNELVQSNEEIKVDELQRKDNEIIRKKDELVRISNEKNRILDENIRISNENIRVEAENNRQKTFEENENVRKVNEEIRISNEVRREENYNKFNSNEEIRQSNEKIRISNENIRVEAENNRTANETIRKKNELIRINSENSRVESMKTIEQKFELIENSSTTKEVENARTDFFGNIHSNLQNRFTKDFSDVYDTLNNSTYLFYEGSSITANNSALGYTKEMNVKGSTIQNLCREKVKIERTVSDSGINFCPVPIIAKSNTQYTVIFKVIKNTAIKEGYWGIYLDGATEENNNIVGSTTPTGVNRPNQLGVFKVVFRSRENLGLNPKLVFAFHSDYGDSYECVLENIMLFEGDYSKKSIPDYIEGIKSVSEKTGKIVIKSNDNTNQIQIKEINLAEPLKALNNSKDEITSEGKLIKKVEKIVLNGSENWQIQSISSNKTLKFILIKDNCKSNNFINDKFNIINITENSENEGMFIKNNREITLFIFKTKLQSQNIEGLKKYLQTNPVTVYYELLNNIITQLPIENINVKTYDLQTNISTENEIKAFLSCKISSNIPTLVQNINRENKYFEKGLNKTNKLASNNFVDINENIFPFIMNLDFAIMDITDKIEINIEKNTLKRFAGNGMTSFQALERLILTKGIELNESLKRIDQYRNRKRITNSESLILIDLSHEYLT